MRQLWALASASVGSAKSGGGPSETTSGKLPVYHILLTISLKYPAVAGSWSSALYSSLETLASPPRRPGAGLANGHGTLVLGEGSIQMGLEGPLGHAIDRVLIEGARLRECLGEAFHHDLGSPRSCLAECAIRCVRLILRWGTIFRLYLLRPFRFRFRVENRK